jgi:hypothetical protein
VLPVLPYFSSPGGLMTAAELLNHCKAFEREHGILTLCEVLETIFESHDPSSCLAILDEDEDDEMEVAYVTVQ